MAPGVLLVANINQLGSPGRDMETPGGFFSNSDTTLRSRPKVSYPLLFQHQKIIL